MQIFYPPNFPPIVHVKRPRYLWHRASEEPITSSGDSTYKNKHPGGLARALRAIKGAGPPQIASKSRTGYCSSGPASGTLGAAKAAPAHVPSFLPRRTVPRPGLVRNLRRTFNIIGVNIYLIMKGFSKETLFETTSNSKQKNSEYLCFRLSRNSSKSD